MKDEDSFDEALWLGIPRNLGDFTGAKRVHHGPTFNILPNGKRRLPHDRNSIHEAKTEFMTFHWVWTQYSVIMHEVLLSCLCQCLTHL